MRGFASPLLVLGIVAGVLALGVAVQTKRVESCKSEAAAFASLVEANGKAAEAKARAQEASDKAKKEKSDADYKRLATERNTLAKRLRDQRASSGILPAAPAGSASPSRACFDRTELERALQRLDAGVSGLVAEGDALGLRLKLAREWAVK